MTLPQWRFGTSSPDPTTESVHLPPMPAYAYQAIDAQGRTQRGVLQSDTPRAARSLLRERGLHPLEVSSVREQDARSGGWSRGLGTQQLAVFARQLAVLVGSGLPIDEALSALAEGSEGAVRGRVLELRARVMEGSTLAAAMAEQSRLFPPLFRASVSAGEASGRLDRVLRELADHTERSAALRQRVLLALTYPLLLTVVALAVVTALMVYVVPQVTSVFAQHGQSLPWATVALMAISDAVRAGLLYALLVIAGGIIGGGLALRQERWRRAVHRALLRLPLLGRLLRTADSARFSATLALLTQSAVPLLDALPIATSVVQMLPLRDALQRVAVRVREGGALGRALAETGKFPAISVRLIQSGERSGRLDEMLGEAARHQERELESALGVLSTVLGPLVILLVGGVVLFIVLAILLPIFDLNSLVR